MKRISRAACLAVLLVPGFAVAKDLGCDAVRFGDEVTKQFPKIAQACRSVTTKNDQAYAKFTAEVETADSEKVVVKFLDKQDKPVSRITFANKADAKIDVDGHPTRASDLKRGTRANFYITHDKWGLYGEPDSAPLTVLSREEL
jgi:hypothetical protein